MDSHGVPGYQLFDTAIGRCGVAWTARGVVAAQLPERDDARTAARLLRRCPDAVPGEPPAAVRQVIDDLQALLAGERRDLSGTVLDLAGVSAFERAVYEAALAIAPGRTCTYGELAARIGDPGAARAVGQALGRNPFAPIVPCHRVLAAQARSGGFSAHGGVDTKLRMLQIERARFDAQPGLFDDPGDQG